MLRILIHVDGLGAGGLIFNERHRSEPNIVPCKNLCPPSSIIITVVSHSGQNVMCGLFGLAAGVLGMHFSLNTHLYLGSGNFSE